MFLVLKNWLLLNMTCSQLLSPCRALIVIVRRIYLYIQRFYISALFTNG